MKAYIIALCEGNHINHTISQTQLALTLAGCEQHGWDYSIWPACDGYAITEQTWTSLGLTAPTVGKIVTKFGAQGCFVSHYTLWQHCVKEGEPIIVLEHDAIVTDKLPELDLDLCIWKLTAEVSLKRSDLLGEWARGSWAYTLTPAQARALIAFTEQHGVRASDKQLCSNAVAWRFLGRDLVLHNSNNVALSTTGTVHSNMRRNVLRL